MGRKPQENPDPLPHPHRRTSASGGSPQRGCAQFARNCATAQAGGAGGGRPLAPAPRRLRGPISSLIAPRASIGRGRGAQPPPPRLYFRAGGAAAHLSRPVPFSPVPSLPPTALSPAALPRLPPSLPAQLCTWLTRGSPEPVPPPGGTQPPTSSETSSAAAPVGARTPTSRPVPSRRGSGLGSAPWGRRSAFIYLCFLFYDVFN